MAPPGIQGTRGVASRQRRHRGLLRRPRGRAAPRRHVPAARRVPARRSNGSVRTCATRPSTSTRSSRRASALPPETPIGDALLDQRVAAGAGNVFKSEICWAERVHPMRAARRARRRQPAPAVRDRAPSTVREPCRRATRHVSRRARGLRKGAPPVPSVQNCDPPRVDWCRPAGDVLVSAVSARAGRHVNAAGVSVPAHVRPVLALRQGCARHRREPRHRLDDRPRVRGSRRARLHLVAEGRRLRRGRRRALEVG